MMTSLKVIYVFLSIAFSLVSRLHYHDQVRITMLEQFSVDDDDDGDDDDVVLAYVFLPHRLRHDACKRLQQHRYPYMLC